jgi:6-phosphogluconolactonase (cycloisomerase 2 family)
MFTINSSTGAITVANGGNALISTQVASMDISPDGNFLFVVDSLGAGLTEYQINTSTGLLSLASTFPIPPTLCPLTGTPLSQTCTVKVGPSGAFVVASLGSAGTIIYPYTSASGITTTSPLLIGSGSTQTNPSGDFSVTLDKNNYIYIARTAALAVYQITDAAGDATLRSTATFSGTDTPRSVALSFAQNYVYTANQGSGNISAYSIGTSATLTQVSGSPFTGPATISAIGTDKSGSYMVAVGYNGSSGLQLFTIGTSTVGTPGALTLTTSAGTGTSTTPIPAVLALSH